MDNILGYIAIFGFVGGVVAFFVKTGEYKNNINSQLEALKTENKNIKQDIQELKKEYLDIKCLVKNSVEKNESNMAKLETMLVEIRARLDIFLQCSGMFNGTEGFKK